VSDVMREAGKKSWETRRKNEEKEKRKWKEAQKKAVAKGKEAMTFTKVRLDKLGWKYAEFKSKRGYPRTGIVDLIAVKLDRKDPDTIKMILFQVKGGLHNRVPNEEKDRLKDAVKKVRVTFNCAEKHKEHVDFHWEPTDEHFDAHCTKK